MDNIELLECLGWSTSWCAEEAEKVMIRLDKLGDYTKTVVFETGYGPSGLPHIGTFGEVARTLMTANLFETINRRGMLSKLICFSDDMDGLRKVPSNVPCQAELQAYIGQPLTCVPDPFALEQLLKTSPAKANLEEAIAKLPSFGECNNRRLLEFLDRFGFRYEFASATEHYKSGRFDAALQKMLENYDAIMQIMLPTLGAERQASYSIFLPISQVTGQVLQVPLLDTDVKNGLILYKDPANGKEVQQSIFGGAVKCQWKADWALRWVALGVDYEMSGKDLIDSVNLSRQICKQLGALPPGGFSYELFLDEAGQKISKSKGNGLTIEQWLKYAPDGSLRLYMYQKPQTAKRLYFDVIPKMVDEYYRYLAGYRAELAKGDQTDKKTLVDNPLYFVYNGEDINEDIPPIPYSIILNIVAAMGGTIAENHVWQFLTRRYGEEIRQNTTLAALIKHAINYHIDYVAPTIKLGLATPFETFVLHELYELLNNIQTKRFLRGEELQTKLLDFARRFEVFHDPKRKNRAGKCAINGEFFQMLYRLLLGQESGPRFGSFISIYGIAETKSLIAQALWRTALAQLDAAKSKLNNNDILSPQQQAAYAALLEKATLITQHNTATDANTATAQADQTAAQAAQTESAESKLGAGLPSLLKLEQYLSELEHIK